MIQKTVFSGYYYLGVVYVIMKHEINTEAFNSQPFLFFLSNNISETVRLTTLKPLTSACCRFIHYLCRKSTRRKLPPHGMTHVGLVCKKQGHASSDSENTFSVFRQSLPKCPPAFRKNKKKAHSLSEHNPKVFCQVLSRQATFLEKGAKANRLTAVGSIIGGH